MNSESDDLHPNWRALATIYLPRKRFVRENASDVVNHVQKGKQQLQNFNGTEIRKFYEKIVSEAKSYNAIEKFTCDRPTNVKKEDKPQLKEAFDCSKFFRLAMRNNVAELKKFDFQADHINARDDFGWTALMMAACEGAVDVVEFLLELGCDRFVKDRSGKSAFDLAKKKGHFQIMELLQTEYASHQEEKIQVDCMPDTAEIKPFFCAVCNQEFTATTLSDHQTSTVHLFNTESTLPPNKLEKFNIPSKNRGLQLMVKQGWDKESGLGPTQNGRLYPIKTVIRKQRSGFGIEQNPARVTHYGAFDLRATLRRGSDFYKKKPRTRNDMRREKVREWKRQRRLRNELS